MTNQPPADDAETETVGPITDHESLRARDVPFHEEEDVVDRETVERLSELDDMAVAGVENESGEVLVMRVTEECAWKPPSASVPPGSDYAATARRWVADRAGVEVEIDRIAGVWCFTVRTERGDDEATRNFVVFECSPANGAGSTADTSDGGNAEAVDWVRELPDDAERPPGSELVFE